MAEIPRKPKQNEPKTGKTFERRVGELFSLLGFSVEADALIAGRQVDLVLEDRSGPLSRQYIVECKDEARPVGANAYDAFRGRLEAAKKAGRPRLRGIMVASVGFTREVRAQAEHDDIELLEISRLEQSLIDFRPYVERLLHQLEEDTSLDCFVEPTIRREMRETGETAGRVLTEWLADSEANQLTLLGDYGTGKTTLLKWIVLQAGRKWKKEVLEGGGRGRVPVLIDLREHAGVISLKKIILSLMETFSVRAASYAVFDHLLTDGQVLLVLDGFDEMASRCDPVATLDGFREINRAARGRAKIILSCRSHYFTSNEEVLAFHGESFPFRQPSHLFTDLYRDIAGRRNFSIVYLEEFNDRQVGAYLDRRCGARAGRVRRFIDETFNLRQLSHRPVFLDMIVASEVQGHSHAESVTPGVLYQIFTDTWLRNNDWTRSITVEAKSELLERFAWKVAKDPQAQLNVREISRLVHEWDDRLEDQRAVLVESELRRASFLCHDHRGHFRFSHTSFQEFFQARHLLRQAETGNPLAWSDRYFSSAIYRFVIDLMPDRPEAAEVLLGWAQDGDTGEIRRINAIKCLGSPRIVSETDSADRPRSPRIVVGLHVLLESDPDAAIRRAVATTLGRIGDPRSISRLAQACLSDLSPEVRHNALNALGRGASQEASQAFVGILRDFSRSGKRGQGIFWSLLPATRSFREPAVITACLEALLHLPFPASQSSQLRWYIHLCERIGLPLPPGPRPSLQTELPSEPARVEDQVPLALALCRRLLQETSSPVITAHALRLLGDHAVEADFERLIGLHQRYLHGKTSRSSIEALRGIRHPRIRNFLVEIVDSHTGQVDLAASILADEYPDVLVDRAESWLSGHVPPSVRMQVVEICMRQRGREALPLVRRVLRPKERVSVRWKALTLVHQYCPEALVPILEAGWDADPAPSVKRLGVELCLRIDRRKAIQLALRGIRDRRIGVRVAMCAVLGGEPGRPVKTALLNALASDDSKWVRIQALRSLAAPGQGVTTAELDKAMVRETDPDILECRRTLSRST